MIRRVVDRKPTVVRDYFRPELLRLPDNILRLFAVYMEQRRVVLCMRVWAGGRVGVVWCGLGRGVRMQLPVRQLYCPPGGVA